MRLQHEWERLNRSPRAVRQARAWEWRFEHVESLDEILVLTGYSRTPADREAARLVDGDETTRHLVDLARSHDLAARMLLQRLLPGLCASARRRSSGPWITLDQALDELLAIAWTVIRTYSIERRPRFVVPNLLRDIEYRAFIQPLRRQTTFVPRPTHTFDHADTRPEPDSACDELAELLELAAQSGIDEADLELARRLGSGETTAQLAAACCVTDRTIRNRRNIVAYRLRQVALACA